MQMIREPFLAKILRYGIYAVALVPLVIFRDYISPFHFGKVLVFRGLVEIMAVLFVLLIWRDRSYLPRPNPVFWAVLAFAAVFSLTTATSILPYASFWGSLERMGGLWTFWHYVVFFIIATSVLRERQHWFRFLEFSVFVGVLSALYGFGQKTDSTLFIGSGGRERIFGTIGNAALFAGYEIINFFLALTLFFRPENGKYKRVFLGSAVVLIGTAIIMTVVRGSLLGFGVGLMLFTVLYHLYFRSVNAKRVFLAFVWAAALFFLVIITPVRDTDFVKGSRFLSRLTDTSFDTYTAKTRFWAWEAGLKGWSESPKTMLLGWGPENFNIPFSKHFNPLFFTGYGSETLFDRAHNMFVEVLVTMGVLGLAAYISIFVVVFRSLAEVARRKPEDRLYHIGLTVLVIAYIIHNLFIFDTSANFIGLFIVLGFVSFLLSSSSRQPARPAVAALAPSSPALWLALLGTALMVGVAVLIYRTDVLPAKANYATTRAIVRGWDSDFAGAMAKYREALSYDVPGKYEFRHRAASYLIEYSLRKGTNPDAISAVKFVIGEVQKNADENPPDYLPQLYLSRLYVILGKGDPSSPYNDEALRHSLRALEISPTFVRTYYEIAQVYLNKEDLATAISYFKKAAELNPSVGVSYWYWGAAEVERKNLDEGTRLIELALSKGYSPSETELQGIVGLYLRKNDYGRIVYIYERLIQVNPKSSQYHASLAVAYAHIGRINDAVAQAKEAARLDPSFEAEGRAFVRSLGRQW